MNDVHQNTISRRRLNATLVAATVANMASGEAQAQQASAGALLPSWREGATKAGLLAFLRATTSQDAADYVPPDGRVAVFDNDGTLWTERPLMPEVAFALARLKELAPDHPEWATEEPFASALKGDMAAVAKSGVPGLVKLAVATQAGTTPEAFRAIVAAWLHGARHPRFDRPYEDLVYQPMLEVLTAFLDHGFRCYVVSAGGVEFLRAWTTGSYGLSPDRVIGSTLELSYRVNGGRAELIQTPKIASFTDGPHKPAAIETIIGQRPIAAFGNSDGDYEMLEYVTTGPGRRLGLIVHHDDADREYAYDRAATVGKLDRALDDAPRQGWLVASMQDEWATIYKP